MRDESNRTHIKLYSLVAVVFLGLGLAIGMWYATRPPESAGIRDLESFEKFTDGLKPGTFVLKRGGSLSQISELGLKIEQRKEAGFKLSSTSTSNVGGLANLLLGACSNASVSLDGKSSSEISVDPFDGLLEFISLEELNDDVLQKAKEAYDQGSFLYKDDDQFLIITETLAASSIKMKIVNRKSAKITQAISSCLSGESKPNGNIKVTSSSADVAEIDTTFGGPRRGWYKAFVLDLTFETGAGPQKVPVFHLPAFTFGEN
jgi:hypothetical protein